MERQGILRRGSSLAIILEVILSGSLIGPHSFPTEVNSSPGVWDGAAKKVPHLSVSDWSLADGPLNISHVEPLERLSIVSWPVSLCQPQM